MRSIHIFLLYAMSKDKAYSIFFRAINTAKEDIKKNKKTVDENPNR